MINIKVSIEEINPFCFVVSVVDEDGTSGSTRITGDTVLAFDGARREAVRMLDNLLKAHEPNPWHGELVRVEKSKSERREKAERGQNKMIARRTPLRRSWLKRKPRKEIIGNYHFEDRESK
jgi:hypothetical protein